MHQKKSASLRVTVAAYGLMGFGLAGCDPSSPANAPSSVAKTSPDPVEAISTLESGSAELSRNSSGAVTQITVRDAPVNESLMTAAASLPQLQNLTLTGCEIDDAAAAQIGKLKNLRHLDLRDSKLGNAELATILGGSRDLQSLRLSGKTGATTVDDAGMPALKSLTHLKVLAADFLWVSDKGLAELTQLGELRELYLANSLVDDAALAIIAKMPNVKKLRLAKTGVTTVGMQHLTQLKLEDLDISECVSIDDAALEPVGSITTLKKLNLWRDAIGDAGAAHLSPLVNLEWLNVDNTQVSDSGLRAFTNFKKLTFLHLGSTPVTDAGMSSLTGLHSLAELKVTRTSVTEDGLIGLRQARPNLDIQLKYEKEE